MTNSGGKEAPVHVDTPNQISCAVIPLSVVVPITKMAGRLGNLESWVIDALRMKIEVILVHDFQDDTTSLEIDEKFKHLNDSNLKILEDRFNAPGLARNRGILESTRSWIAFWDADDIAYPGVALELLSQVQNKCGVDLIVGSYEVISQNGRTKIDATRGKLDGLAINPGIWRIILRRSLVSMNSFSNSKMGEDQEFLASIEPWNLNIIFSKEVLYQYYFGGSNQLTSNRNNLKALVSITKDLIDKLNTKNKKSSSFIATMIVRQILTGMKRSSKFSKLNFLILALRFTFKYAARHPLKAICIIVNILWSRGK